MMQFKVRLGSTEICLEIGIDHFADPKSAELLLLYAVMAMMASTTLETSTL